MKGIRVLHQKLTRTHDAETRPDLVTELRLDLVEIDRQLLVAFKLTAGEIGDDFFGSRRIAEFLCLAIIDLQQLRAEFLPAFAFFPQFPGLDGRHQHLDRTGAIHLLTHDGFDLAQHAQAQR